MRDLSFQVSAYTQIFFMLEISLFVKMKVKSKRRKFRMYGVLRKIEVFFKFSQIIWYKYFNLFEITEKMEEICFLPMKNIEKYTILFKDV